MGLFYEQLTAVRRFIDEAEEAGRLRRLDSPEAEPWPSGSSLVLEEDTVLELGNPSIGSLSMLVWAAEGEAHDGAVSLVGPDLAEASGTGLPFAQVVIAAGDFPNEYDSYRDLRDAVYDTKLK